MGVATAVLIQGYMMAPVLFWLIGRRGPVATSDFYRVLAVPMLVNTASLLTLMWLQRTVAMPPGPVRIAVALLAVLLVCGSAAVVLPGARRIVHNLRQTAGMLRQRH